MPLCLLTVDDVGRAGKMKPGRVGMVTQRLGGWSVEQWHQNPDWLSYIPLFRFRLYFDNWPSSAFACVHSPHDVGSL